VQALHLVAGGAWLGGTVPLFIVVRAGLRAENTAGVCRALRRFSTIGTVFVALVLATGVVNGALRITRAAELTGTEYGRTLLLKAGLVLALVVLALLNRCALLPRLERMGRGGGAILGAIGLEWIVGLCVLAVAVMLGGTPPPL
jgi:copper resistance protein D